VTFQLDPQLDQQFIWPYASLYSQHYGIEGKVVFYLGEIVRILLNNKKYDFNTYKGFCEKKMLHKSVASLPDLKGAGMWGRAESSDFVPQVGAGSQNI